MYTINVTYVIPKSEFEPQVTGICVFNDGLLAHGWNDLNTEAYYMIKGATRCIEVISNLSQTMAGILFERLTKMSLSWSDPTKE